MSSPKAAPPQEKSREKTQQKATADAIATQGETAKDADAVDDETVVLPQTRTRSETAVLSQTRTRSRPNQRKQPHTTPHERREPPSARRQETRNPAGQRRRGDNIFGTKYAAKIKAGRAALAGYSASQRTNRQRLRPITPLYFKNSRGTKAWQMKKILFDTIYDKQDRQPPPLIFIRNIGNSMLEILVAKGLEDKVASIMKQWGFTLIKEKIDPVVGLLKKNKDQDSIKNAEKCKEKAQEIVDKFSGPEVVNFYKTLIANADAAIEKARANSAPADAAAEENEGDKDAPANSDATPIAPTSTASTASRPTPLAILPPPPQPPRLPVPQILPVQPPILPVPPILPLQRTQKRWNNEYAK